jgi:hypothetical protein
MYSTSCEVRTKFIYVEESRPPLWSSGKSSWLHNGDVLCFLWGTDWIYICHVEESRPPLWSSGQSYPSNPNRPDHFTNIWPGKGWNYVWERFAIWTEVSVRMGWNSAQSMNRRQWLSERMGCPALPKGRAANKGVIFDWSGGDTWRGTDPIPCTCMQQSQVGWRVDLKSWNRIDFKSDQKLFMGLKKKHENFRIILTIYFVVFRSATTSRLAGVSRRFGRNYCVPFQSKGR